MPFKNKEEQKEYNKKYSENKRGGPVGTLKERICIRCGTSYLLPSTHFRKLCEGCLILRARESSFNFSKTEKAKEPRKRAIENKKKKEEADPQLRLWRRVKGRAKAAGIEFNIQLEDIKIPVVCPVLGTPFKYKTYYVESLDRIDSNKGYTPENVQVMSHKANAMKNSASKEELLKFAEWVFKTYK